MIKRRGTIMFWLALTLTIPFLVATSGVTLWGALVFGRLYSHSDDSLIWGLDVYGLWILGIGVCIVLGKLSAPVFVMTLGSISRTTTAAFAFIWLGTLLASAIFVIPAAAIERLDVTQASGPHSLYLAAWPIIDAIASLLPAILTNWRQLELKPTTKSLGRRVSTGSEVFDGGARVSGPSISGRGERDLLGLLQDLTERSPGIVVEGVAITPEKWIVTTQRKLAALQKIATSTTSRLLYALEAEGCVRLRVSPRETRIQVLRGRGKP